LSQIAEDTATRPMSTAANELRIPTSSPAIAASTCMSAVQPMWRRSAV